MFTAKTYTVTLLKKKKKTNIFARKTCTYRKATQTADSYFKKTNKQNKQQQQQIKKHNNNNKKTKTKYTTQKSWMTGHKSRLSTFLTH